MADRPFSRCLRAHPYWLMTLRELLPIHGRLSVTQSEAATIQAIGNADRAGDFPRAAKLVVEMVDRAFARGDNPAATIPMLSRAAYYLLKAKDADAAFHLVEDRISRLPESGQRALLGGIVNVLAHRFVEGALWLDQSVVLNPDLGEGWAALSLIYALERDHSRAELAARNALRCGVHGRGDLIDFVLMQSTFEQGLPVEGTPDFSTLSGNGSHDLDELLNRLPHVDRASLVQPHPNPVVFVAADDGYLGQYAVPLVLSLAHSKTPCGVHLHIMNPGRQFNFTVANLRRAVPQLPIQVSTESVYPHQFGTPSVYYSTVRFCRLYQLLLANSNPILSIDADSLARRNLFELPGFQDPKIDLGLAHFPDEPIWQEISAAVAYFKPCPASVAFLKSVAAFIAHNLLSKKARWLLDQVALYAAWRTCPEPARVQLLEGPFTLDQKYRPDSPLWVVGNEKYEPLFIEAQRELLSHAPRLAGSPQETHPREIVSTRYGQMLIWSDDSLIGHSLKARGTWCHHELDVLCDFIKPGFTVVDAGANIGSHTLPFAQWVGGAGQVIAFEPQRLVFQVLMANLALNGIANTFCIQRGLGRQAGKRYVAAPYEASNFGAVALRQDGTKSDTEEVEIIALDSLHLDACHLIKMDIEGMEYDAILGARQTIERHRPVLYLENHPSNPAYRDLIESVRGFGYRLYDHGLQTTNPNMLCLPQEFIVPVRGFKTVE